MKILVFGNRYQGPYLPQVISMLEALSRRASVVVEPSFYDYLLPSIPAGLRIERAGIDGVYDLALSFGGDGTLLRAASDIASLNIPIMGVNTGHLGFLAGGTIDHADQLAHDLLDGNYTVETRAQLRVSCPELPESYSPYALNEVAILKKDTASMITIDARLNFQPLANYQADGLIIATPTGSTAYNLSVGGPIIDPAAAAFVISPVAPHTLTMRPLVVAATSVIEATPRSRADVFTLSLDGRSVAIPCGATLTVTRADRSTLLARPNSHTYLDTLRSKLLWGK